MNDDDCWKCNTCVGGRIFEDHVYCVDCYEYEILEVAHKRLEEINRLMPILAAKDSEVERLKAEMGPLYPAIEELNAQCNKYDSEIERLKAQAEYHFESQREDYNRLEDTLVANDDLKAEIEQLNAELDYSADYANKQQAEIVRLRKVLSFITTYGDSEHFSAAGFAGFALKEQGE